MSVLRGIGEAIGMVLLGLLALIGMLVGGAAIYLGLILFFTAFAEVL